MKRYFFDTTDGDQDIDRNGVEFVDDEAARDAAIRYAGSMINDKPSLVAPDQPFQVHARDDTGKPIISIAVRID